jgi:hypothetical protein
MKILRTIVILSIATATLPAQTRDSIDKLADDFWTWRAKYAPFNGDDVPRMERPDGIRDWSREHR